MTQFYKRSRQCSWVFDGAWSRSNKVVRTGPAMTCPRVRRHRSRESWMANTSKLNYSDLFAERYLSYCLLNKSSDLLIWLRQDYGMVTSRLIRLQSLGQLTQSAEKERRCDFTFWKKRACVALTVSNWNKYVDYMTIKHDAKILATVYFG